MVTSVANIEFSRVDSPSMNVDSPVSELGRPKILCTLGFLISASMRITFLPDWAIEIAMLQDRVDFPSPALGEVI